MKNAGTGLSIGGITLDFVGAILYTSGLIKIVNNDSMNSSGYYDGEIQAYIGGYALGFGIPMTIAGAVLHKIGRKKTNEYNKRLGFKSTFNSMSIVYNF